MKAHRNLLYAGQWVDDDNARSDRCDQPRRYPASRQLYARHRQALKQYAGYRAIVEEAERLNWPQYWSTDLYLHDCDAHRRKGDHVFLWAVRPAGTWHVEVYADALHLLWAHLQAGIDPQQRWYWWDGQSLRYLGEQSEPGTADRVCDLMASEIEKLRQVSEGAA